jgi:hypothetical protein
MHERLVLAVSRPSPSFCFVHLNDCLPREQTVKINILEKWATNGGSNPEAFVGLIHFWQAATDPI